MGEVIRVGGDLLAIIITDLNEKELELSCFLSVIAESRLEEFNDRRGAIIVEVAAIQEVISMGGIGGRDAGARGHYGKGSRETSGSGQREIGIEQWFTSDAAIGRSVGIRRLEYVQRWERELASMPEKRLTEAIQTPSKEEIAGVVKKLKPRIVNLLTTPDSVAQFMSELARALKSSESAN